MGDVPYEDPVKQANDHPVASGGGSAHARHGSNLSNRNRNSHGLGVGASGGLRKPIVRSRRSQAAASQSGLLRGAFMERDGMPVADGAQGTARFRSALPPGVSLDEAASMMEGRTVVSGAGSTNTGATDPQAKAERRLLALKAKRSRRLYVDSGLPGPSVHRGTEIILRSRSIKLDSCV